MRNRETRCDYRIRGSWPKHVRCSSFGRRFEFPSRCCDLSTGAQSDAGGTADRIRRALTSKATIVIFITKYLVVITLHLNGQRLRAREISVKPKYHRASRRASGKP